MIANIKAAILRRRTLSHYDRMIAWVEKQDHFVDEYDMEEAIHETPMGDHCPLCLRYCTPRAVVCIGCPVKRLTLRPFCKGSPWEDEIHPALQNATGDTTSERLLTALQHEREFLAGLNYKEEEQCR